MRILGSGGGAPSRMRETSCVLVRDGDSALLLDLGTGVRRLVADGTLLAGVAELHVVLTHFHFDHVCGLPYLSWFCDGATIWAPGKWLYGRDSAAILGSLRRPPVAPSNRTDSFPIRELSAGDQAIGPFDLRTSAQPRHWAPSAGLRVNDELAFVTDTPYEPASAQLAAGVDHMLHEAWSSSRLPLHPDRDATAADAARVAVEAGAGDLTPCERTRAAISAAVDDELCELESVRVRKHLEGCPSCRAFQADAERNATPLETYDLKLGFGALTLIYKSLQAVRTLGALPPQDELLDDTIQLVDQALNQAV